MANKTETAVDVQELTATPTRSTLDELKDFLKSLIKVDYAYNYRTIVTILDQGVEDLAFIRCNGKEEINCFADQIANLSEWYEGINQCTSQKELKEYLRKSNFADAFCGGIEGLYDYIDLVAETYNFEKWIIQRVKKIFK